jgi:hypothetical protein
LAVSEKSQTCRNASPPANPPHQSIGEAVRSGKFQILGEGLKWIDAGTHPTVWSIIPKMRWQIIGGNLGTGPHIL